MVAEGTLEVDGLRVGPRDGVAITGQVFIEILARETAEVVAVGAP